MCFGLCLVDIIWVGAVVLRLGLFCEGVYVCLVCVLMIDEFVDTFWGFVL